MAKVCRRGMRRLEGVDWHPELTDKGAGVKTHTYWAMKNCEGCPQRFKGYLDNIVPHYQNVHNNCSQESRCHTDPQYVPSRLIIRSQQAANILQNAIESLYMYKHPEKYILCASTHYVESFNNVAHMYLDKRVHFKSEFYDLKIGLCVLDWNEHVDRPHTSVREVPRAQNPRRTTPVRIRKPKTFKFVDRLWDTFVQRLAGGQRFGEMDIDGDSDSDNDE